MVPLLPACYLALLLSTMHSMHLMLTRCVIRLLSHGCMSGAALNSYDTVDSTSCIAAAALPTVLNLDAARLCVAVGLHGVGLLVGVGLW